MDGASSLNRLSTISRIINRGLGGRDEMLCARAYRRKWWAFVFVMDGVFILVRRKRHHHCEEMYRWECIHGRNIPTPQIIFRKKH